uniref:Fibrillin n=1 Tax=Timema genevievae TaxID=629358 RepID=A0A7R9PKS9_TIMGE|nr:unnamed protein product [Timema genevievae]
MLIAIPVYISSGCSGSPCAFGCSALGGNGFSCGCPSGYQRIGQGHCLSTINPLANGFGATGGGEDIGNVPTYPIDTPDHYQVPEDKLISTEGCFTCKINGRHKRSTRENQSNTGSLASQWQKVIGPMSTAIKSNNSLLENIMSTKRHSFLAKSLGTPAELSHQVHKSSTSKKRKVRHHHEDQQIILRVSLNQTKHRLRIIKLQPAIKFFDANAAALVPLVGGGSTDVTSPARHSAAPAKSPRNDFEYIISIGNTRGQFEMVKKHGVWALHFRRRLKHTGIFDLEIDSRPIGHNNTISNDSWEKPLSLRVRIIVTE